MSTCPACLCAHIQPCMPCKHDRSAELDLGAQEPNLQPPKHPGAPGVLSQLSTASSSTPAASGEDPGRTAPVLPTQTSVTSAAPFQAAPPQPSSAPSAAVPSAGSATPFQRTGGPAVPAAAVPAPSSLRPETDPAKDPRRPPRAAAAAKAPQQDRQPAQQAQQPKQPPQQPGPAAPQPGKQPAGHPAPSIAGKQTPAPAAPSLPAAPAKPPPRPQPPTAASLQFSTQPLGGGPSSPARSAPNGYPAASGAPLHRPARSQAPSPAPSAQGQGAGHAAASLAQAADRLKLAASLPLPEPPARPSQSSAQPGASSRPLGGGPVTVDLSESPETTPNHVPSFGSVPSLAQQPAQHTPWNPPPRSPPSTSKRSHASLGGSSPEQQGPAQRARTFSSSSPQQPPPLEASGAANSPRAPFSAHLAVPRAGRQASLQLGQGTSQQSGFGQPSAGANVNTSLLEQGWQPVLADQSADAAAPAGRGGRHRKRSRRGGADAGRGRGRGRGRSQPQR